MLDAIKPLLESGLINEDVSNELQKVWEGKLTEARDQVRGELREEFAQRYEHDRSVMVEALDKMLTENLSQEIKEFHEEKKQLVADRVATRVALGEHAAKFNDFMVTKLAEEIKELRNDRKAQMENQQKLEKFIVHALAKEIKEFAQDKKAVVEARVRLVAEGREKLEELKAKFVAESAEKVGKAVSSQLKGELSQLKEDIKLARENNFGRKLFEAFASEYSVTYLNDKAEARKLMTAIQSKEEALAKAKQIAEQAIQVAEIKDREARIIKESTQREKAMDELLAPLNKEKKEVMKALLESVQTPKLQDAFAKYLPAVLNTGTAKAGAKTALTESVIKEVTGDKETAKKEVEKDPVAESNLIDFKRLAGLK
jgi:hypothetical protein